jgi:transcriptional regulator with XRE-family HTH domain
LNRVRLNAKALWDAIARENMSQNEFAAKLGISSGYMSQLVCGTRYPSPRLRRRMLESFGNLTFNDLFVLEDKGDGHQN